MNVEPVRRVLETARVPYALIGGQALAARGYPRFTVDIDLLTTDARVLDPGLWRELQAAGATVECRRGDDEDPLLGVVHILLRDDTDIDLVVGRWKWESDLIGRAEWLLVAEDVRVPVPQVSDLVLLKLAAGGFTDLHDAAVLLSIGNRDRIIGEVDARIGDVRPDVRGAWDRLRSSLEQGD